MAYSSAHWSIMNFSNRPSMNNNSNNNNNMSSSAVANSVDSLSVAVESSTCTTSSLDEGAVFPSELRRILNQVAHCGVCPTLSWFINTNNTVGTHNAGTSNLSTRHRHKKGPRRTSSIPSPSSHSTQNRPLSGNDIQNTSDVDHCSSDGENTLSSNSSSISKQSFAQKVRYSSLREAVAHALLIVLDRAYKKTGYTLSPAERKRLMKEKDVNLADCAFCDRKEKLLGMLLGKNFKMAIAKFTSNRYYGNTSNTRNLKRSVVNGTGDTSFGQNPPFTIQRVAEILYSPEHYYKQTHKLCNALEKLLLVTSTANAFGGSSGGEVRQRLDEEREKAALAGERGRENEERRTKRRLSYHSPHQIDTSSLDLSTSSETNPSQSSTNRIIMRTNTDLHDGIINQNNVSLSPSLNHYSNALVTTSQDSISPHHSEEKRYYGNNSTQVRLSSASDGGDLNKIEKEKMTWKGSNSLGVEGPNDLNDILKNRIIKKMDDNHFHFNNFQKKNGFANHEEINHHEADTVITANVNGHKMENGYLSKNMTDPRTNGLAQNPPESIILGTDNKSNLESISLGSSKVQDTFSALIRDYAVITPLNGTHTLQNSLVMAQKAGMSSLHSENILYPSLPSSLPVLDTNHAASGSKLSGLSNSVGDSENNTNIRGKKGSFSGESFPIGSSSLSLTQPTLSSLNQNEAVKLEFEIAPINHSAASSAGGLDLDAGRSSASTSDSESYDDVDDCASDRSDGSDSSNIEPFTAARVMALNRMQQQQRREQLLNKAMATGINSTNSSFDFRPPPDSEYQSGDSIDSMMAEDSGGSDSSLSDMAD